MATEKRLIDANELLRRENKAYLTARIHPSASAMVTIIHKTLQDLLNDAPTVDAFEVVHCLECINYKENGCKLTHGEFEPEPEFFCGYGERKGNG